MNKAPSNFVKTSYEQLNEGALIYSYNTANQTDKAKLIENLIALIIKLKTETKAEVNGNKKYEK